MSEQKIIKSDELQERNYFTEAFALLDSAATNTSQMVFDKRKTAGSTAIQAFIGPVETLRSVNSDSSEKSFRELYSETADFLKKIGVDFDNMDKMLAERIKSGE